MLLREDGETFPTLLRARPRAWAGCPGGRRSARGAALPAGTSALHYAQLL